MRFLIEKWALVAAITFQGVNAGAGERFPVTKANSLGTNWPCQQSVGANIQACIYLAQKPSEKYYIEWTAGSSSDHCMYDTGHNATMGVSEGGITCTSVGYVYHKASSSGGDLCATHQSVWGLSYNGGKDNVYSGSTLTHWEAAGAFLSQGHVWLVNQSKDIRICPSKSGCSSSDIWWRISDTPDVFIIFYPRATASDLETGEGFGGLTIQPAELR